MPNPGPQKTEWNGFEPIRRKRPKETPIGRLLTILLLFLFGTLLGGLAGLLLGVQLIGYAQGAAEEPTRIVWMFVVAGVAIGALVTVVSLAKALQMMKKSDRKKSDTESSETENPHFGAPEATRPIKNR